MQSVIDLEKKVNDLVDRITQNISSSKKVPPILRNPPPLPLLQPALPALPDAPDEDPKKQHRIYVIEQPAKSENNPSHKPQRRRRELRQLQAPTLQTQAKFRITPQAFQPERPHKIPGDYQGEYLDGKRHGFGKLFSHAGQLIYEGDWIDNYFGGRGELFNYNLPTLNLVDHRDFSNCFQLPQAWAKYEGEFKNGLMHGIGHAYFANGDKYCGGFENN